MPARAARDETPHALQTSIYCSEGGGAGVLFGAATRNGSRVSHPVDEVVANRIASRYRVTSLARPSRRVGGRPEMVPRERCLELERCDRGMQRRGRGRLLARTASCSELWHFGQSSSHRILRIRFVGTDMMTDLHGGLADGCLGAFALGSASPLAGLPMTGRLGSG